MNDIIKVILDGKEVEAKKGDKILAIAEANGVDIPTFCNHPELKPFGSCFMCVVEVEGGRGNLIPSCSTPAADGMVINTKTERTATARKTCIDLLLSDHEGDCLGPCMVACPAGIDIPGFVNHIANERNKEALELIKHNMPLPGMLGRVCTRPCEIACRGNLDDAKPIAICHLKRYAADEESTQYLPEKEAETGKTIAIIGAGPAGLTAAYYLQLLGHSCTIFDTHPYAGGMLRYGIPSYRLPRNIIEDEATIVKKLGAEFKFNTKIGTDISFDDIKKDYDAVFVAIGAQGASAMRVEGEDLEGVLTGIGYLGAVEEATDKSSLVGEKVMVVGGGNTAMDVCRTALRTGAKESTIFYRRTEKEMPALDIEIEAAKEEGVSFKFLSAPTKIEKMDDGKLAVTCITMELGEPDESGRRRPVVIEGSERVEIYDTVIAAIGQKVDPSVCEGINKTKWNTIDADNHTQQTNETKVFAGGDCVIGADIAVTAVGAGRRAAISINQFLLGKEIIGDEKLYNHTMGELDEVDQAVIEHKDVAVAKMPELEPKARATNFEEVETGFTKEMAIEEAKRCMSCGCRDAHECKLREYATEFGGEQKRFTGQKRKFDRDDSHDNIVYESGKCIQCGTCVRITDEILETNAFGLTGRGITSRMKPALDKKISEVNTEGIEQTEEACPVGALTLKDAKVATLESKFKQ